MTSTWGLYRMRIDVTYIGDCGRRGMRIGESVCTALQSLGILAEVVEEAKLVMEIADKPVVKLK